MASYRPYPPPPQSFPPPPPAGGTNQNLPPPPPPPPAPSSGHHQPYTHHRGYAPPPSNYPASLPGPYQNRHHPPPLQPPAQQHRHYQYAEAPPPPPPSSSYPPPPPPQSTHPVYYPSQGLPPPDSLPQFAPPPPPSSSLPPPPPPPVPPPAAPPPPPPPNSEPASRLPRPREAFPAAVHSKPSHPSAVKHQKDLPLPPPPSGRPPSNPAAPTNGLSGRVETEEERRARKKREYERQKHGERRQQALKQSQANILQKTQMLSSATAKPSHGSAAPGSHMHSERRTNPLLSGDRFENRLKKPTTFLCKLKFRNELPDPTAQPKLLSMNKDKDRYTKYTISSLEKMHKPKLYAEPDLGLPLDLMDLHIYNPPDVRMILGPEDEELLRDDEVATPIKQDGIRKKDRPTDKGVSWLVKTQYISPLSADAAKMSITEKQAKEMRQTREGTNLFLEELNSREKQIHAIEESFKAAKLFPVHQTKPGLEPARVLPLLPDFDRYDDRFIMVNFDGDPTADSETFNKLDRSTRDELESQALMKSFIVSASDHSRPEKFLSYMVPAQEELSKDIYDEDEDVRYSWIREYHLDVRGEDADDPTTYLVTFGAEDAKYLPLPTKLILQKKKAKEGRSGDEVEHYPVPSRITVRKRDDVAVGGPKESGGTSLNHDRMHKRAKLSRGDSPRRKLGGVNGRFSDEEDMSD